MVTMGVTGHYLGGLGCPSPSGAPVGRAEGSCPGAVAPSLAQASARPLVSWRGAVWVPVGLAARAERCGGI